MGGEHSTGGSGMGSIGLKMDIQGIMVMLFKEWDNGMYTSGMMGCSVYEWDCGIYSIEVVCWDDRRVMLCRWDVLI